MVMCGLPHGSLISSHLSQTSQQMDCQCHIALGLCMVRAVVWSLVYFHLVPWIVSSSTMTLTRTTRLLKINEQMAECCSNVSSPLPASAVTPLRSHCPLPCEHTWLIKVRLYMQMSSKDNDVEIYKGNRAARSGHWLSCNPNCLVMP